MTTIFFDVANNTIGSTDPSTDPNFTGEVLTISVKEGGPLDATARFIQIVMNDLAIQTKPNRVYKFEVTP